MFGESEWMLVPALKRKLAVSFFLFGGQKDLGNKSTSAACQVHLCCTNHSCCDRQKAVNCGLYFTLLSPRKQECHLLLLPATSG